MTFPNPLIPGFNPDPSVVAAGGAYYLVTSTFEYLPGIPVYRSTDLTDWTHIGTVAARPEQAGVDNVATGGGVWAPTIRYRDGVFYVIVTIAMSPRGCVVFTATDPAGPWSDGVTIDGVTGIDPDVAWDDDGTAYVTFSGLLTTGEQAGQHAGIQQVRADLAAGKALEEPRSLWSGTGLKFPEAPHLYRRGDYWYLMIAEGGTERGHAVSVARGASPEGPFEGHPANPVLSARSTARPIQNTGHADLVDTPDGGTALVLLGMRPLGITQSFSPLGRETFITPVSWADGWPRPEPVRLAAREAVEEEAFDFNDPTALDDPGWLAVRATPASPVLGAARERGIGVILGTPTYAVPMWLARRYPEIAAEAVSGHRVGWGARQEVNFTHAAYRFHAERVIRQVVGRYRDHPAIIGYQVDNEPGLRLLYNADVFEKFTDWLRCRYGTVGRLNEEWGLAYWSHRLSRWSDLWRPEGNFQPQYDLAWRRFQAELVTDFIGWQAGIARDVTGGRGFVTTCISYDQPGVEDVEPSRVLDMASGNAYYEMQDSLAHPNALPRSTGPMGWVVRGPWAVTQLADLMYSSKQAPFLVTETNAGSVGFSSMNESPYDGQWRQLAWLLVARGARLVEYWHWNTLPFGAETYWGGVLPHSGVPGRVYHEIARIGQELRDAGGAFADAEPDYDIAVLYDSDSKFALSAQGPLAGAAVIDPDSYRHILAAFSRGIFDAKRQQRIIRPRQLLPSRGGSSDPAAAAARYPVLIAAAFYTAADDDLDFLVGYARAGGHLVVGPRTGYGDREGRARIARAPARITDAAGTWYEEMASLTSPVPVHGMLAGAATGFAEGLDASGAEVLARYQHPHLRRWAAVTTRPAGAGCVTVVGTVPDQALAAGLARWLVPRAADGWTTDAQVTVATSTGPSGARLHVLHNWGWEEATACPSSPVTDMLSGSRYPPANPITLRAWDVRLLRGDDERIRVS